MTSTSFLSLCDGLCMYNSGARQLLYGLHVSIDPVCGRMCLPSSTCAQHVAGSRQRLGAGPGSALYKVLVYIAGVHQDCDAC